MTIFTVRDMERAIAANLHRLRHVDTVVGVPRSGMITASLIATQLQAPLADLATAGRSVRVGASGHIRQEPLGHVLLVEDALGTGKSMRDALALLMHQTGIAREQITTCAVWCIHKTPADAVDLLLGGVCPREWRVFTWNLWKHKRWSQWATDLDGVLCPDAPKGLKEAERRAWAQTAPAKHALRPVGDSTTPDATIGAIITSRPESWRELTTDWLQRLGAQYSRLVMAPGSTVEEVTAHLKASGDTRGTWKARMLAELGFTELYVESNPQEASVISKRWPGDVWCTDAQSVFKGGVPA